MHTPDASLHVPNMHHRIIVILGVIEIDDDDDSVKLDDSVSMRCWMTVVAVFKD